MAINFKHLDARTRAFMAQEVEGDVARGSFYLSKRFNDRGRQEYPSLLLEAVKYHDDDWLALQLYARGCLNHGEIKHLRQQQQKEALALAWVPYTAGVTIAEGEFNRYYMRAVCRAALEDGVPAVLVYRGKAAARPRQESEGMIGKKIPAAALLDDLRAAPGSRSRFGIPAGPNSGLTVCLP